MAGPRPQNIGNGPSWSSPVIPISTREELLLHSRYIRDDLAQMLARTPDSTLPPSDSVLIRSILSKLNVIKMNLNLLRYSRIEKALMVIAIPGTGWPIDISKQAIRLLEKWGNTLGSLKHLRADLYEPGGRLEGVMKITSWRDGVKERDDVIKSPRAVKAAPDPSRAHRSGHLGFEVGDWWLKPAAAFRAGIIDETAHGITADTSRAYALVLSSSEEVPGTTKHNPHVPLPNTPLTNILRYQATFHNPTVFKLMKTCNSETDKMVRVLRSWKLDSSLAPKAGLRYDGLYILHSYAIKLYPPSTWLFTFTLSRCPNQAPLSNALRVPYADQLDDWADYQTLKTQELGPIGLNLEMRGEDGDEGRSEDGGYYWEGTIERKRTGEFEDEGFVAEEEGVEIEGAEREWRKGGKDCGYWSSQRTSGESSVVGTVHGAHRSEGPLSMGKGQGRDARGGGGGDYFSKW